ncbi:ATP-binding protein [Simiduia sp. 21SJ11W-1]|uniref:ATP-binding protein n=1 Tax=Simiduia sp. 21SJ11W-1 TaxID=2909669 RepID=UPI0020A1259C|nr:ATP-binding protein [Simiduia sp. 21SJ11W-1]UTA47188.1 ATP-binding protein [Simiduia sp. 21SJ11W-1]
MDHAHRLPRLLVAFVGLLGVIVIIGWHTASPTIVQLSPNWAPMQYNTALCMLLTACMLLADWAARTRTARILATALIALPLLTLVQYLTGADFGIDQLFITPFVDTQTSHPGRMAPNTALAFIMIGATGWLRPEHRYQHLLITALASLTLWLSLLALMGYLSNLTPAYGWGSLTAMAAHTAIGFVLLSAAIILTALFRYQAEAPIEWQLACAAPLMLMLILAFQLVPIRNSEILREEKTQADLALLQEHIYLKLNWLDLMLNENFTGLPSSEVSNHFAIRVQSTQNASVPLLFHMGSQRFISLTPLKETIQTFAQANDYSYQLANAQGIALLGAADLPINTFTGQLQLTFGGEPLTLTITPNTLASNNRLTETNTFILAISLTTLVGFFVILRNIRRRSKAEAEAAALYARFKQAINTFNEGFAILTPDGTITDKNNKLNNPHAKHLCDLIEPTAARELLDYLYSPDTESKTLKTTSRDGAPLAVNLANIPGSDSFVLVSVNLRESLGQLKVLEHQQALINSAFNASTNGLCVLDGKLTVVKANQTLCDWFKKSEAQLLGQPLANVLLGENTTKLIIELESISANPGITRELEIKLNIDNHTSWMQARGASEFSPDSKSMLTTLSLKCIDQQKSLIEQLNQSILELSKSNEELDQFAYVASHDLKSPLVGIKNISDWLDEDYHHLLPEEGRKHLQLIRSRCRRMMTLLDDLLQYSRAGRLDKAYDTIDLKSFAQDILSMYDIHQTFSLHCDDTTLHAPRVPLETLLRNLVNNSIKHHHCDSGNIYITVEETSRGVTLHYSDDGPGIDEKYYTNVIKPFTTLAPKDKTEGSGMGLAIIAKIADSLNGKLTLGRGPEGGLKVSLRLPNKEIQ